MAANQFALAQFNVKLFHVEQFDMKLQNSPLLKTQSFIDGAWVGGGKNFAVRNPATGAVLADVADLGAAEIRAAVAAAKSALPGWRGITGKERAKILRAWNDLILQNVDALAEIMTLEQGKPLAEARAEIVYAASFVEWFAEEAKRVYGDVIPEVKKGTRILVMKQAVGVVGAITPWNFPCAMVTRKCAPALAAGCTVVLKPAEQTPLSALALAELARQAGFPNGVFNVVCGSDPVPMGMELTTNPDVKKISFTGSTEVGKILMRQSAGTVKKLSLELGGNSPFIVFADADLDAAVLGAMASKFRNNGQTCVCANRILVERPIYEKFTQKLLAAIAPMKIGNGMDAGVQFGPLIDRAALQKVSALVEDAKAHGGKIALGGKPHALGQTFFEPTVILDANTKMQLSREEIFGPVAALYAFDGEDEAVQIANDTAYGLAAYCYTRDLGRAFRMADKMEFGVIGINEGIISSEVAPFGGIKESGFGREGSYYGIEDYLTTKYVLMGGI